MQFIKAQVWALNRMFDASSTRYQISIMAILLLAVPLLVITGMGLRVEEENAQLVWLVWTLWVWLPRFWYCHSTGALPWRKKDRDS